MKKIDRTGERNRNVNGLEMEILEYKNNKDIKVLFVDSGIIRESDYRRFVAGKVYPTWRNKGWENLQSLQDCDNSCPARFDAVSMSMAIAMIILIASSCYGLYWIMSLLVN